MEGTKDTEGTAIISSDASLHDLTAHLMRRQKDYLCLRLLGLHKLEAQKVAAIRSRTVNTWEDCPDFLRLEEHLLSDLDRYSQEAELEYFRSMKLGAKVIIENLIHKGVHEWDNLAAQDKNLIYGVAMFVLRMEQGKLGRKDGGSYEEFIHKLRKEI